MFISDRRTLLAACAAILITASGAVPAEPLTLAGAIEQTLARNPDLGIYAHKLHAQQARTDAAALRPPLELHADLQDVLGTGRASGFDIAETTFAVSQVLELGDKRDLRVAAASAGSGLIDAERAAAELDVLTEVTRRFIHVAADQEHLLLTQRASTLAAQTVTAAEARVAAARAPDVELRRARVTLARAAVEQEHAEHELLSSRRKLAAMWGEREPTFDRAAADLYALPSVDTFETLLAGLANNPDFLRFASTERLRDAELRLAEARTRSNLTVSAGVRFLQETTDRAFVFGVTMPLSSGARTRSAVAEAEALHAQTAAERDAHRVQAEAQLFEIYQELRHALTEAETLRASVLPEMEAALDDTRYAYERGRYSHLEWVDAQRELVDVQRALIDAAANAHLYRAELERLTGDSLSGVN